MKVGREGVGHLWTKASVIQRVRTASAELVGRWSIIHKLIPELAVTGKIFG
jgi:hypothetical protein